MNGTNQDGSAVRPTAHQWRAAWLILVAVGSVASCCSCAPSLLAQEPKLRAVFKGHTDYVTSVATPLDVKIVGSGSMDGTVKIWDVATGKERATLTGHTGFVWSVAITRDGKTIASGGRDKTIKLWNIGTGKETMTLKGHTEQIRSLAFTPDGKTLASGSNDLMIKLWDVVTGQERATLRGHTVDVGSLTFTADGKTLVSGSYDTRVILWDVATGQERVVINGDQTVLSVAITRDGKTVATGPGGGGGAVKLWNVASGKVRSNLPGHTLRVWGVAFSPDGQTLASASWDGTVKLWDVATGELRTTLKGLARFYSVAFTEDGKTLIAGGGMREPDSGEIVLWEVGSRE